MWIFSQSDPQPDLRSQPDFPELPGASGHAKGEGFLLRLIRAHLLSFAVAVGISFALIYFETTTRLFFNFDAPRQRGDPCLTLIRPTNGPDAPAVWANFGRCADAPRDPERETIVIDLRFGLLLYYKTEPVLLESLPLPFTRVLRNLDHASRAFGKGGTHTYDMGLVGDAARLSWVDLVTAGGGRVHYRPTAERGWFDSEVSGYFAETTLQWTGRDWRLRRDDGIEFIFPASENATRLEQAALVEVRATDESVLLVLDRDQAGNLRSLRAADRRVDFAYDALHRVTALSDDTGYRVGFEYDSAGCLVSQTGSGGTFQYEHDGRDKGCRLRLAKHDGVTHFQVHYSPEDRVVRLADPAGGHYVISYETDGHGKVARVDVVDPEGTLRRISMDETSYWISRWGSYRGQ